MRVGILVLSICAAMALNINGLMSPAHAQLFNLLGAPSDQPFFQSDLPQTRITVRPAHKPGSVSTGNREFCVRMCDGRYFPVTSSGPVSSKEFCKNFCPTAETRVYSGADIDSALSTEGKPYSKNDNAFRFRKEFVAGCTCQADKIGLAHIRIEDDKTIKVGDIVANANGLMVASREGRNGIIFSRIRAARLKAERLPEVASR